MIFKMGDTDLPSSKGKSPENKVRTLYFQSQITILFDNILKKYYSQRTAEFFITTAKVFYYDSVNQCQTFGIKLCCFFNPKFSNCL